MAEPLTVLQEKLATAHGLAIAAAGVTREVEARVPDLKLRGDLRAMRREAEETRARCLRTEASLGADVAAEMLSHANTIADRAGDLAVVWFKAGTDPLSAWSFLAMGEAGEVTTWSAVAELALQSGAVEAAELAAWALPVQRNHLSVALDGAVRLAGLETADAPRFG